MQVEKQIPLLDSILEEWKTTIGKDFEGYKNHVYRMVNCCFALKPCSEEEREKIVIAAVFHDIGLWVGNTLDYIPPSIPPAMEYLKRRGLESWSNEISLMISEHHKIRQYAGSFLWFFINSTVIFCSLRDNPIFQNYQKQYERHHVVRAASWSVVALVGQEG